MKSISGKITLVQQGYGALTTSTYQSVEELVLDILTSNGAEFVEAVENRLLPEAKRRWEEEESD